MEFICSRDITNFLQYVGAFFLLVSLFQIFDTQAIMEIMTLLKYFTNICMVGMFPGKTSITGNKIKTGQYSREFLKV